MDPASMTGARPAPPPGMMISEQLLESAVWRVQLDLATAGARSLLWRGSAARELADPETEPHLFQGVAAGAAGVLHEARFFRARARFDDTGARLAVESVLAGGVWRTEFGLESEQAALRIRAGWSAPNPGVRGEVVLALRLPGGEGAAWMPFAGGCRRLAGGGFQAVAAAGPAALWDSERGTVAGSGDGPLEILLDACEGGEAEAIRLAERLESRIHALAG